MYAKKIRILNYGPIEDIDIDFPFDEENPKPVLLVGENGSGKSILLSHIVNALMIAHVKTYPESNEMETGKIYKYISSNYIKSGSEYYFGRVDFEKDLYYAEMKLNKPKKDFVGKPANLVGTDTGKLWNEMTGEQTIHYSNNINDNSRKQTRENIFKNNCVLYFPHNRFEEPAWLNEDNLNSKVQYMNLKHIQGRTDRKIINYSPLQDNQNWLFEVVYDRCAFEVRTISSQVFIQNKDALQPVNLPIFANYDGVANTIYEIALNIVRQIFRSDENLRFGIGKRQNRKISLMQDNKSLVPNIFQLSSGETAILNLFLSILRNFDLSGASFLKAGNVRGIVIVDEIDLHLHSIHQYEVLPTLIKLFPRVQFIITTHSPLFVLGMNKAFGEDGFALYRLPQGRHISPEEFSEFGDAYQSFAATRRFSDEIQQAIENAQKPIVFVDGTTDMKYLQKASELLGKKPMTDNIQIKDGDGHGNLDKAWSKFDSKIAEMIPQKVILLHDCDQPKCKTNGNLFVRSIPKQENHPLEKGIENLFEKTTLEKARASNPAFIDIESEHEKTVRGKSEIDPEEWSISKHEKTNLCDWLCRNGTVDDFKYFQTVFDLLEGILNNGKASAMLEGKNQSS